MYLYNLDGTVVTGPVTASENISSDRTWSSNSFQGNSVILELRIPKNEENKNDLHISKVLLGLPYKMKANPSDSLSFGNFNTSSSCNKNVLCSEGNAWINERKAICLIETSFGALATGALIANTCNTNRPYLLTAWHVVNGRNPNDWTYIFGWWSSTCTPNTYNQQALLFNGASLKATYEQTDCSLLELFQIPSPTSDITYLGWSRSSTIPSSSVGIHHPSGDQMKISFANGTASIGTIYTYPNTAWRVLWNLGASEPGSSGSPLFDVGHRVIGQAYSATQPPGPPCNQQTGGNNYGRFDLSWTGGGTNSTRLSNWLDPSNTGAVTANTTNVSNLISLPASLSITGSSAFCTGSQQYTLTLNGTTPAGSTVSWEINPGYGTISPTGNPATVTASGRGFATITAKVNGGCDGLLTVSKVVSIGAPVGITSTMQAGCNAGFQNWLLTANPSTNGSNWNWTVSYVGTNSQINIYSPNSSSTYIGVKGGGTVRLNYTDACGVARTDGVTVYSTCPPSFRIAVSPNPATNNINLNLAPADLTNQSTNTSSTVPLRAIESKGKTIISLYELNTVLLVKQWKQNETKNSNYNLDVNGLRKGIYVLQVDRDNETRVTKIIIE